MPTLMKGNVYKERLGKKDRKSNPIVKFPMWAEIKHDEIRCHVIVDRDENSVKFLSYAGKPLCNMERFEFKFMMIAEATGFTEFDCGFEVNRNYNDSYRWVRSSRGIPGDLQDVRTTFYLYDLPQLEGPWSERLITRTTLAVNSNFFLEVPEGRVVESEEEVDEYFKDVTDRDFEGLMLKTFDHTYQRGKRTDGWLKVKPEEDADGIIVGFVEATATVADVSRGMRIGDALGRAGSVMLRVEGGGDACPHGIPHALGRDMLENPDKYLGQWCEFKYMEKDRRGGYRHPRFFRLREDKV